MSSSVKMSLGCNEKPVLSLLRGGAPSMKRGRRRGMRLKTAAEIWMERKTREAFFAVIGDDGKVPSESIQKVREGVQSPKACAARRYVEMHAKGCSIDMALGIVNVERDFVLRLWNKTAETVRETVTFFQSGHRQYA